MIRNSNPHGSRPLIATSPPLYAESRRRRPLVNWSRAVIVGASSGIGEQLARQLAAAGSQVVLVARREELIREIAAEINAGRAEPLASFVTADVRDAEQSTAAFDRITAEGEIGRASCGK